MRNNFHNPLESVVDIGIFNKTKCTRKYTVNVIYDEKFLMRLSGEGFRCWKISYYKPKTAVCNMDMLYSEKKKGFSTYAISVQYICMFMWTLVYE